MRVKACHFSSVHSITDTRVFYRECRSLAKFYDVTLIGIGNFTGDKDGVHIIGINKPSCKFARFFYTVFKVFSEAVHVNAQVYHIHDAEMIPFGIILSLAGKKVIYDIHENTSADILLKPWLPLLARKLLSNLYNSLLKLGSNFMHYIVVIADPIFLKDFFVKAGQYTIIENFADGNDLAEYRVPHRSVLPGNNLFYIGMMKDMYYNINILFEAMYLLKQKGAQTHLHCIGYFGEKTNRQLNEFAHWEEIKDRVTFYGFMNMKDAYRISMQCKIGICLKNQPPAMLVSHERKLFEYMAIGLPSVFCDTHIYTRLNQQYHIGVAVDLEDATQLASGIERLLADDAFLEQLSANNLYASENACDWSMEELKLVNLYKELTGLPALAIGVSI